MYVFKNLLENNVNLKNREITRPVETYLLILVNKCLLGNRNKFMKLQRQFKKVSYPRPFCGF